MVEIIDTHAHLDGEEYAEDLPQVIQRAKEAGITKVFLPAIHLESVESILRVCDRYPDFAYPMVGLHPEEVKDDFRDVLSTMKSNYLQSSHPFIAIGEVGLDYYWSREFEKQQLEAFEEQVRWSVETQLPLMIHCRKAQNELVKILRKYEQNLPGGVFHCFTGNEIEARELLSFENFVLGIGGVLTFKKNHLPEVLPSVVPLSRIVLETDSPYMAPVPHRGKRNESAYVVNVLEKLAESYHLSKEEVASCTNQNVKRLFGL
ncbi:MAG: TatD family hydrolase [Prevotella sp.]|nr:TatD family hydrolase [Prevotella sp.]